MKFLGSAITAAGVMIFAGALPAAATIAGDDVEGLQLSVMQESVPAGSSVELQWEIVPDDLSSASLVLGIIMPDGSLRYYDGCEAGFKQLDNIDRARRIVTGFPFNTRMSGALSIEIPSSWPAGVYQFICFVCQGKLCADIVYSNSFQVTPPPAP